MAQTELAWSAIESALADNTTAEIGPQDHRDVMASALGGYGGMLLSVSGAPATMSNVPTTYALVDVFDTITAQSSTVNTGGTIATLASTYDFEFGAAGIYAVSFWASFSTSANNHLVTFRPHLDGVAGVVEVDRWIGTNTDTGVVAFNGIISYTVGQKVDMRAKVDSGTIDLTFLAAGFNVHRVG